MIQFLDRGDGVRLAYAATPGAGPTVVFLPGFKSDMQGAKALALEAALAGRGQAMLRLDYSGHGQSDGAFEAGTISRWRDDVLALVDRCMEGPLLLVGSSMGGWLALLVALARPARVAGLVLVAPAPDFTDWGLSAQLTPPQRAAMARDGFAVAPSVYDPAGYRITRALIEDGEQNRLMQAPIAIPVPVRILQGQQDDDVPWRRAVDLAERLAATDVQLLLIKDGDHRLSRPQDLALLAQVTDDLRASLKGKAVES